MRFSCCCVAMLLIFARYYAFAACRYLIFRPPFRCHFRYAAFAEHAVCLRYAAIAADAAAACRFMLLPLR